MSASDKKKLRAAERAEKMTEKQLTEQKEAKKLKIMSTVFVVVLALMLCFAVVTAVTKTIEGKGLREKNTVALTVNDHEISNAELNYYFIDSVNNFYNNYGAYASLFGLDLTKPLNEQYIDEESGLTWADDFLTAAIENAKAVYAMNDAANAAGFTLSDDAKAEIDAAMSEAEIYALYYYGYGSLEDYLKAMFGQGATVESYRNFCEMTYIANEYQYYYADTLVYEDADIREAEAEQYDAYSSYSYNSYYMAVSKFTDEAEAEAAAKALAVEENNTVEALDAAIAALPVNAETTAASTAYDDVLHSNVSATYAEWVTDASRKAGDITYIAYTSTSTDENGKETTTVNGYYVVLFNGANDNTYKLNNVRHLLVSFTGGTKDENGTTTYSDEEKAVAKSEAENLLAQYLAGEQTEEAFAALVDEKTDDTGSKGTGGLYENIHLGSSYVENFLNWANDESRKVGETGIVETEYGYHIMYFVGESEESYRDSLITTELRDKAMTEWEDGLIDGATITVKNTGKVRTDLKLSSGN